MPKFDYTHTTSEQLFEMLFVAEDRLDRETALEMARREDLTPLLAQLVMDKHYWLSEPPEWWAVVHATYILGQKGTEREILPILTAMRWADAFDCDWVTEVLPSIFGRLGPAAIPGLTMVLRDRTAGWSARDLAMKGLAAISINHPDSTEHVFRLIGERFMDEEEDRVVRQLAGQILLDFRVSRYRMALLKFAREDWRFREGDIFYLAAFGVEDVEWCFKNQEPDTWHYTEDWMRFYEPGEIQRRQKRWIRERLGTRHSSADRLPPAGGGSVVPMSRNQSDDPPQEPEDGKPSDGLDQD